MQRFTDLKVWQRSHRLVLATYRVSRAFPSDERFGLTSQVRRAAVSVATNIAEGSKRKLKGDFARFLNIAEASLAETEYLVMLARDLAYLKPSPAKQLLDEVFEISCMLTALRKKVESA